jgi:hypothetical protein
MNMKADSMSRHHLLSLKGDEVRFVHTLNLPNSLRVLGS